MNLSLKAKCCLSLLLGLGLSLLSVSVAQAQCPNSLCYVDADRMTLTMPTGISWTTAYTNLQDALAVAQAGDEIWVAEGVYYPDEGRGQTNNDVRASFALTDGVKIYGGFAGTETERSQRQPKTNVTVLSGDIDGNDGTDGQGVVTATANIRGANAYNVIRNRGVSRTAVLDGFTITAGNADAGGSRCVNRCGGGMYNIGSSPQINQVSFSGNSANEGGGMYNRDNSHPKINQVSFSGNRAGSFGGGMYNLSSSSEMSQVSFSGNSATHGGGMYNLASSPEMSQVSFSGNRVDRNGDGGGMYNQHDSSPEMSQISFSGNSANRGGGMFNTSSSDPEMSQVSFSGNRANLGGGMFNTSSSDPEMSQVSFSGNRAYYGGGMFNYLSHPQISNSIFWANAANGQMNASAQITNSGTSSSVISDTLIQGSSAISILENANWLKTLRNGGHNLLDADPLFREPINPADAPTRAGNLRLEPGSPAIDAGDDRAASGPVDLDGAPRIQGGRVDLGAYEAGPIVSLSKAVSPAFVESGQRVTYTLVLSNSGAVSDSVRLSDTLPSGVEFAAWVAQGGAQRRTDEISWQGPVTAGESITITFGVTNLNSSGTITNRAQFSGSLQTGSSSVSHTAFRGRFYVDADVTLTMTDGLSWTTAYTNLQDAFAVATAGDEIWVAEGVYYPDEGGGQTNNNVRASFGLTDGVKIYGGFAGTETSRSQRQPRTNVTVLSGDIDGNDGTDGQGVVTATANIRGANAYNVIYNRGVSSTAVLDGFTITAGHADAGSAGCRNDCGGGMYNSHSSPQISQISFSGNLANKDGGGMVNFSSHPEMSQVSFSGNFANGNGGGMVNWENSNPKMSQISFSGNFAVRFGGGMFNDRDSNPEMSQVSFSGNSANEGGGMFNRRSNPEMSQVSFRGNRASSNGGGMLNSLSVLEMSQVSFSGNRAGSFGGGMYNISSSRLEMSQVSFSGNSATLGGGVANLYSSNLQISNSIFWGNAANGLMNAPTQIVNAFGSTATIRYTLIQGSGGSGSAWVSSLGRDGGNNLDADPMFREPIDPAQAPTTAGNLRLKPGCSPAIDAGDDQAARDPVDLAGATRIQGRGVDLGAYESRPAACVSLSKAVSPALVDPDQRVTYTLVLSNSGLGSDSVRLSDPLPSGVEFAAWGEQQGAMENANEISWQGLVTAGESISITFGVTNLNSSGSTINNRAQFRGSLQTGSSSVSYTVRPLYVDADGMSLMPDGLSWTTAYPNLQDALAVAVNGDEIWVAEGVYYPDEGGGQINNNVRASFALKNGVRIYGGFAGTETERRQRQPKANLTVLSGDIDGDDIKDGQGVVMRSDHTRGMNAYNVIRNSGVNRTAVLDGFTITAGYARGNRCPDGCGGGMYNVLSHPQINQISFSGNFAVRFGGGMYNERSNPEISQVSFSGNSAANFGGGMSNERSSPKMSQVSFSGNFAVRLGGGMYNNDSNPEMSQVSFSGNRSNYGGGMSNNDSSPKMSQVSFSGNFAPTNGGGMYNVVSNPHIVNSIFWHNGSRNMHDAPAQIQNSGGSSRPVISDTLVQNSGGNIAWLNSLGNGGHNLLDADPLFRGELISLLGTPTRDGDLRLKSGSPAIDAGDDRAARDEVDLDGAPRIQGAGVDLGAYEAPGPIVSLSKAVSPAGVEPDQRVTYTLVLSNSGLGSDSVRLSDTLPSGVKFAAWGAQGGAQRRTDEISWQGPVTAGESISITFLVNNLILSGPITNRAQFSGSVQTGSSSVSHTVLNVSPLAADDTYSTTEDIPLTIISPTGVLSNDDDLNGDSLMASVQSGVSSGTLDLKVDGSFVYTPAADVNGQDHFSYQVSDGVLSDTALVTITIAAVNDGPVAFDDTASTKEDEAVSISVLSNDTDVDDINLSLTAVSPAQSGTTSISGQQVVYSPSLNFAGTDSFTYRVSDGVLSDTASVTVTVNAVNDRPVAIDDTASTKEDEAVSISVLSNDADVEDDSLSLTAVSPAQSGTTSISGQQVVYSPSLNFAGTDSFTYRVSDGVLSDTASVTVTVNAVNDAPVAIDDTASTKEDEAVSISVLSNDADVEDDSLSLTAVSPAQSGTTSISGQQVVYSPSLNFAGTDSFTYRVSDGVLSDTASVTVTVNAVNDRPVAIDDTASTKEDEAVSISVLSNDQDVEDDSLSLTAVSPAQSGTTSISGQQVVYSPSLNFAGTDSFTYRVSDGVLSDTASVTVTVNAVNDRPVAIDDTASTKEDEAVSISVLSNDADVENDSLSLTAVSPAQSGTTSISGQQVVYSPSLNFAGTDSFTYIVSDGSLSDTASVTVTVNAVNDGPVAIDDTASTKEDEAVSISVLSNDADVENDSLSLTAVSPAQSGTTSISGKQVVYSPSLNFAGTDSFTYRVSDGVLSDTASVTVTVNAVNDAPLAVAGADQSVRVSQSVTLDGSGSSDVEGDALRYGWQQTGGVSVTLNRPNLSRTTFIVPATPTILTFRLTVTDEPGLALSADEVVITATEEAIAGLSIQNSPVKLNEVVTFTARITAGTNVSYTWDFGDRGSAVGQTVTHVYTQGGTYTATVEASNSRNSLTATTQVRITEEAIAGLSIQNSSVKLNEVVTFTARITAGTNVSYRWDFGDRGSAVGQTVTHVYTQGGTYTATVEASNSSNTLTATTQVRITEEAIAGLSIQNSPVKLNEVVTFTARITAGDNVSYRWDFGDRGSAVGQTVTHVYTQGGTYTATVEASNSSNTLTATTQVRITEEAIAGLSIQNSSVKLNEVVTFTARITAGDNVSYRWDFGDRGSAVGQTVTHVYTQGGTYTATVEASNSSNTLTATTQVRITEEAIAGLSIQNSPVKLNEVVTFSARITAGTNVSYRWDFGDRGSAVGQTVTHVYTQGGTYTVTVEASNSSNRVTATTRVRITEAAIAGLSIQNSPVKLNEVVTFSARITAGTNVSYRWDFGDRGSAVGQTVTHVYTQGGTYTATVEASNSRNSLTATTQVRITEEAIAGLSVQNSSVKLNEVVTFTANITAGTNVSYRWDFGDRGSAVGQTVTHVYTQGGTYTATVEASNSSNSLTATTQVRITEAAIAGLSIQNSSVKLNEVVTFTANITAGTNVSYRWDFGDRGSAVGQTVTHVYTQGGTYTVTVEASNSSNRVTATTRVRITEAAIAGLSIQNSSVKLNEVVTFTANITAGTNVSYRWDFGDRGSAVGQTVTHVYTQGGTYTATVEASNSSNSLTATTQVRITEEAIAGLSIQNSPVKLNEVVTFTARITAGTNVSYRWDFGDRGSAVGQTVTHVYTQGGTYTATVEASNSSNRVTATTRVRITEAAIAGLSIQNSSVKLNEVVTFTANITAGTNVSYRWDFGDRGSAVGQTVTHVYTQGGTYTATVEASNSRNSLTATTQVRITEEAIAGLSIQNSSVKLNEVVTFSARITAGTNVSYRWDFGDRGSAVGQTVTHVYTQGGTYTATVEASNSSNTLTATTQVRITEEAIAGLSIQNSPVKLNEVVTFTARITAGDNVSYTWDFGDRGSAVGQTVTHVYTQGGTYTATVEASNSRNSLTATTQVRITEEAIAGLSIQNSPVKLNEVVTFTARITAGTNVSYTWDFGDRGSAVGQTVTHVYTQGGTYTATVEASNSSNSLTATTQVRITEAAIAGLSIQNSSVKLNEVVTFTARITAGDNVSYRWDFGDRGSAVGQTVTHVYTQGGTYTATVEASNSSNTLTATTQVRITEEAIAGLSIQNSPVKLNEVVTFTARITAGDNVSYTWDFGDRGSAVGQTVTHVYTQGGTYTATVEASNSSNSLTATTQVRITEEAIAGLSIQNSSVKLNEVVTFTARITAGDNVSYTWDFGDRGSAVGQTVTHVYTQGGTYTATVEASNSSNTLTATTQVRITEEAIAGLSIQNSSVKLNEVVTFTARITAGDNVSYRWDFGDRGSAVGQTVTHVYTQGGTYTATVEASNSRNSLTATTQVRITEEAIAGLSVQNSSVKLNEVVTFTANITAGTNVSYRWDFGDRGSAVGQTVTHVYTQGGTYTATVEASNSSNSLTATTQVRITEEAIAGLSIQNSSVKLNEVVTFTARITAGDNVSYTWDFGGGVRVVGQTVTHVYTQGGTYTATVEASNSSNTLTATTQVRITEEAIAGLSIQNSPVKLNEVVTFTARITAGDNVSYRWDFGDRGSAVGQTVTHVYTQGGTYTATVEASNSSNSLTATTQVRITEAAIAGLSIQNSSVKLNEVVTFTANITAGTNVSYRWDFGDRGSAVGQTVTHVYTQGGTYTATVEASNSSNSLTATTQVRITEEAIAGLSVQNSSVKLNEVVTFTANITAGTNVSYRWDFGDRGSAVGQTVTHVYTQGGTYTATVEASNSRNSLTATTQVRITEEAIAGLSIQNSSVKLNEVVTFSARITAGTNVSYRWDFGDRGSAVGQTVTHVYTQGGTYTVTVEASNSSNRVTATTRVRITEAAIAGLSIQNSPVKLNEVVTFSARITAGTNVSYRWDFGDRGSAVGQTVTHVYTQGGTYTATVEASNSSNSLTATTQVRITEEAIAGLSIQNSSVKLNEVVTFTARITAGDNVSYTWDFGGGVRVVGQTVTHVYTQGGTYTATVEASNSSNTLTATTQVRITEEAIAGLSIQNSPVKLNEVVTFTARITAGDNVSYRWDFGDRGSAVGQTVTHVYTQGGTYTATVEASNSSNSLTATTQVRITEAAIAGLSIQNSSVKLNEVVTFTANITAGTNVSYRWDFGDRGSAVGQTVTHVYTQGGTYTATVEASNSRNSLTATTQVRITEEAIAGLSIQNSPVKLNEVVTFTARITAGDNVSYRWDFGDRGSAVGQTVTHVYTQGGTYTATVEASNSSNTLTATTQVRITEEAIAGLSIQNSSVKLNEVVTFTARITAGTNVSYRWDFGDRGSAVGQTVTHVYTQGGTYTATVEASNSSNTLTATTQVRITEEAIAGLSVQNSSVKLNEVVTFTARITAGTNVSYRWDFGDRGSAVGQTVTHVYTQGGTYTATVEASNSRNSLTATTQVRITEEAIAGLSIQNSPVKLNEVVTFTARITAGDNVSYRWDFGDRGSAVGQTVTHVYTQTGTYTATVVVSNSSNTLTATTQVRITEEAIAGLSIQNSSVKLNEVVTFTARITAGTNVSYRWDFGDRGSAVGQTVTHVYTQGGTYTATVEASNSRNSLTATTQVRITEEAIAGLSIQNSPVKLNEVVTFTARITAGDNVSYRWDFGDRGSAVGQTVTHVYTQGGTYTATVEASNSRNSLTATTQVRITEEAIAGLSVQNSSVKLNEVVTFTANITAGTNVSYRWDFGDRGSAVGQTVTHVYTQGGTYTATVEASNSSNRVTATTQVRITEEAIAGLSIQNSSVKLNEVVTFTARITAGDNVSYTWDFGGGVRVVGQTVTHVYTQAGTYTASVLASNSSNRVTATTQVRITEEAIAGLSIQNSPVKLNEVVTFTARITAGDNVSYRWNFGAGFRVVGQTVTHVYTQGGTYTATVEASNSRNSLTATTQVRITEEAIAGLSIQNSSVKLNEVVTFSARITAGTNVSYRWDFGDRGSAVGQTVTHVYTQGGTYTATVEASNSSNSLTATTQVRITEEAIAGLSIQNSSVKLNEVVTFTARITAGDNVSYRWDFGDRGSAVGQTVTHVYTQAGTYTATVEASNSSNSLTATTQVRITEEAIAGLSIQNSPVKLNEVVTFTARITAGDNVSYRWNFGAGFRVVGQTVTHVYTQGGTYTATVEASNSSNRVTATTLVSITPIIRFRPWIEVTDYLSPVLRLRYFTAYQGGAYSYTVKVSPILMRAQAPHLLETPVYRLSAPHKPPWLDFVDHRNNKGTLMGVPGAADQGENPVTILATDGQISSTAVFTITVVPNQVYLPLVLQ